MSSSSSATPKARPAIGSPSGSTAKFEVPIPIPLSAVFFFLLALTRNIIFGSCRRTLLSDLVFSCLHLHVCPRIHGVGFPLRVTAPCSSSSSSSCCWFCSLLDLCILVGAASCLFVSSPIHRCQISTISGLSYPLIEGERGSPKSIDRSLAKSKGKPSVASSSRAKTTTTKRATTRGKAEKKVYSLPGQKFDPPEEREPLRIFYESLSRQIPSSEMAEFWLMEHGLLSPERAKKAYDRKQKRQQQIRLGTPIKSSVKKDKPESSKKPITLNNVDSKAKKRVAYSDDDDDFIVKMKRSKG